MTEPDMPSEDGYPVTPEEDGYPVTAEEDGYSGPARLIVGEARFDVQVDLRGHFEPIDGRYHWYGRIASDESLDELLAGVRASGVLQTPHGSSPCQVSEPDTWQRYRLTGYSTPPFRLHA